MNKPKLKKTLGLVAMAAWTGAFTAHATVVAQYSFEGNLNDTAAGGSTADTLTYVQGTSGSGTAQYVPGVPGLGGQAALFDGNYFTALDSADVGLNDNTWTLEMFIQSTPVNSEWDRLLLKWDGAFDYHFALRNNNLDLFNSSVLEEFQENTVPATDFGGGEWHHVAVTSSGSGAEAWIDGESVWTGGAISLARSADNLGLGDGAGGPVPAFRFTGLMDEVRIHDEAVDQAYINGRAALLIPEPSVSFLLGLCGCALLRRRRSS